MLRILARWLTGWLAGALLASCGMHAEPAALPPVPASSEGFFTAADGAHLFYRRIGDGEEALVYVHGGPASGFQGAGELLEPLAGGRTLILYDQRSAGMSEVIADPARLTLAANVRDLEDLRAHFGFGRMTLIAHSFGAAIAAHYAAEHPDRVARLILVSPVVPTRAHFLERARALNARLGPELIAQRDALAERIATASDEEIGDLCRAHSRIVSGQFLAEPTPEKLARTARRCDIPAAALRNRERVRRVLGALGDFDLRPMLARIRAPTLIMDGLETHVPPDATRAWAETIAGARLVLMPDAGHEVIVDQPDAFIRQVERFLHEAHEE